MKIKEENQTLATITLQNYFRMYDKLAGMTGTAADRGRRADEHLRARRGADPDQQAGASAPTRPTSSTRARWPSSTSVAEDIAERYEQGQPVLVGTVSVEKSEYLSRQLNQRGIPHEVLNAKQHTREAVIVAQAGRLHAVTVATNMAGRGVDILLGGNPEGLARHEVLKEGHAPEVLVDDVRPAAAARADARGLPGGPGQGAWPATTSCSTSSRVRVQGRGRRGPRARRPLRHRLRAPRVAAHRQPAARPLRPPGRSRREPLLPQPRRRADAPVRHRRAVAT